MKTKLTSKNLLAFLVLAMSVLMFACEGKEGDPGPVGEQGPKGDKGDKGEQGDLGETGSANVIYSEWFVPTAWESRTGFSNLRQIYFDQTAPLLDEVIINSGVIQVYAKLNGYAGSFDLANKVVQLPFFVLYSPVTGEGDQWSYRATIENMRIVFENNNNTYTSISLSHAFRYVLIPGAVNARLSVDLTDYEAVKQAFKIPD